MQDFPLAEVMSPLAPSGVFSRRFSVSSPNYNNPLHEASRLCHALIVLFGFTTAQANPGCERSSVRRLRASLLLFL